MEADRTAVTELVTRYTGALLDGEISDARLVVDQALSFGMPPSKIYLDVIAPSQIQIGEKWLRGEISVADEHLATEISIAEMCRIRTLARPRYSLGMRAAVTAVEGESHHLAPRMVADFLTMDGWDVDYLGADTPTEDLLSFLRDKQTDLLCISVTITERIPAYKRLVAAAKQLSNPPKLLAGGAAFRGSNAASLEGVPYAEDAADAVKQARLACGITSSTALLSQYLKDLGGRIVNLRKARHLSQQEAAARAGLDRAYLSSVENGKQNLTLGAVFRLAEAFQVSMEELLVSEQKERF